MRFINGGQRRFHTSLFACTILLSMTLVVIAGCMPPPPDKSCVTTSAEQPACFWVPGVFLVGLLSNTGALPQSLNAIPNNVTTQINKLLHGTGLSVNPLAGLPSDIPHSTPANTPPALMVFDRPAGTVEVAIASYQLVRSGIP